MKKIILLVLVTWFCTANSYGSSQSGFVSDLQVRASDGLIYFNLSNATARTGVRPACATRDYWILVDENSETGRKQYAMLLAAATAYRRVIIKGSEDCTRWIDGEDINSISYVN